MTLRIKKKTIFLVVVLTACGSGPKETVDVPKVESFLWESGEAIPEWFIKDGTYQIDCLAMPRLIDGAPTIYQRLEYTIKKDWLGARISIYESRSGCSELEYVRAQEASIDMAYVGEDSKSKQKYTVYSASKRGRTTQQDYYLSDEDADLLNKYNICGKAWQGHTLNSVLGLTVDACNADVERIDAKSMDKAMARWIVSKAFLWTLTPILDMSVRDGGSGIWVKSGPGLILDPQERFFPRAP